MRKLWEFIAGILILPWLIVEWIWSLVPKVGIGKFMMGMMEWILPVLAVTIFFGAVILGCLFTDGIWIFATYGLIMIVVPFMGDNSFDESFGVSMFFGSILTIAVAGAVYLVVGAGGVDMKTVEYVEYNVTNPTYIVDPSHHIVMDKVTLEQHFVPRKEFYEFRETGCTKIFKRVTEKQAQTLNPKFNSIISTKYTCEGR